MKIEATRRALIGGLVAAPVAATPAIAAIKPASLPALISAWKHASAACASYELTHLAPARSAYRAACDAVPHVTTKASYMSMAGERRICTSDEIAIGSARGTLRAVDGKEGCEDWSAVLREAIANDDARLAEMGRLRRAHRVDYHMGRVGGLEQAMDDAWDAVLDYEPASTAELLLKLQIMEEAGEFADDPACNVMVRDMRRLLAGRLA